MDKLALGRSRLGALLYLRYGIQYTNEDIHSERKKCSYIYLFGPLRVVFRIILMAVVSPSSRGAWARAYAFSFCANE